MGLTSGPHPFSHGVLSSLWLLVFFVAVWRLPMPGHILEGSQANWLSELGVQVLLHSCPFQFWLDIDGVPMV